MSRPGLASERKVKRSASVPNDGIVITAYSIHYKKLYDDEEMTNMIKYQRAFEAAARTVNTVNEMFQTIINMV